jgi:hypothetical protein
MGRYGDRGAAEQMDRDGIRTLRRWSKPKRGIGASIQHRLDHGKCGDAACTLDARYSTPLGNRCFGHAIAQRTSRPEPIAMETE